MSRRCEMLGGIEGTSIQSEGQLLIGTIYIGLGEGKRPTVLLLHGLPGFEKNVDIAYALREMGWNVLIPHYRGCWGSEGNYRFTGIPTDVKNAITLMETKPYVDQEKIFLVGHSLGAWATIITTAQDPRVKGAVAIAGGATSTEVSDRIRVYLDNIIKQRFLKGITLQEAIEDWAKLGRELAAQDWVDRISPRPLLMIGGQQDVTVTPDRVRAVFERAKEPKRLVLMEGADHVFTRKRRELMKTVTNWLKTQI
ncbi:MAG: alpha/beta hydrolase [Candidatus Bathyarchaeia archaeon]